jgi:hypothetical protein
METWYVMEDGSCGDPREIEIGSDGVLRHRDGRAVAMAPHGPRSRSVDADAERAKSRSLKSDEPKTYRTREVKAKG